MSPPPPTVVKDAKASLIKGALWSLGMRWSIKGIGLLSTFIMARFLAPQDYGVVALAFLVVGLVDAFLNAGSNQALVRIGNPNHDQINSAWTLRAMQGVLMAVVLTALAPLAAQYFHEPRVQNVLWIVAAGMAFMGFSNIGMALAYRDLQFGVEYRAAVTAKLSSALVTLATALYFGDYRALVCGILAGYVCEFVLSYRLHPYRPRWCTSRIPEIWAISKWLLTAGIGNFVLRRTDQIVAGRVGTTREYGLFTVGADIGQIPTGELGPTLTRPLFPILASMQGDLERAKSATLRTLSTVNSVTIPLGFGLAAVSAEATLVLLGAQWREAAPFVAGFAMIGVVQYLTGPLTTLMNVVGHVKVHSKVIWMEFAAFALLAAALTPEYELIGLIVARLISGLLHALMVIAATHKYLQLPAGTALLTYLRPVLGSVAMYVMLTSFSVSSIAPIELMTKVILGGGFYVTWMLSTWALAGKPDGIETMATSLLTRVLAKWRTQ
ncbi:lipopolysaccharide biosynthesis protein [Aquabacterium sp.]|uniref:lipopolysaccharide biosynthesis protein n=1 Tax=Aquabacterium sp. TaxID=1872578 RepID=UPI003D078B42